MTFATYVVCSNPIPGVFMVCQDFFLLFTYVAIVLQKLRFNFILQLQLASVMEWCRQPFFPIPRSAVQLFNNTLVKLGRLFQFFLLRLHCSARSLIDSIKFMIMLSSELSNAHFRKILSTFCLMFDFVSESLFFDIFVFIQRFANIHCQITTLI